MSSHIHARFLVAFTAVLLSGCATLSIGSRPATPDAADAAAAGTPQRAELVKLISWAEESTVEGCEIDLEGTEPPASFTLRYEEDERGPVVIENVVDDLFTAGWEVIDRTGRGYGFERAATFRKLDFDIQEELRCSCGEEGDPDRVETRHLIQVEIDWAPGGAATLRGRISSDGNSDGAVRDSDGAVRDSDGAVRDSDGAVRDSDGAVRDSDGAVRDSDGAVRDSDGAVRDSDGAVRDSDEKVRDGVVTRVSGRLDLRELRFTAPMPGEQGGECSSRFLAAILLDQPTE